MRDHLKHHSMHYAMCGLMVVIGVVLLATGSGAFAVLPILGCVAMMMFMMWGMGAMTTRHRGERH